MHFEEGGAVSPYLYRKKIVLSPAEADFCRQHGIKTPTLRDTNWKAHHRRRVLRANNANTPRTEVAFVYVT